MVQLIEHARAGPEPLNAPVDQVDRQLNAQQQRVSVMLLKDGALKNARTAPVGHGSEFWEVAV